MELPPTPARQALDTIEAILDRFDPAHAERGDLLTCAQQARTLASRLTAVAAVLLAKADTTQESMRDHATPTTSWLTIHGGLSKREAAGMLHQAKDPTAHPDLAATSRRYDPDRKPIRHARFHARALAISA
ncbi:MAG: hypothetical protein ACOH1Y_14260 [Propionicimonas sp.]